MRNAYAKRQAERKRRAEPQVPKQEDDFLKGFWGEREQDTTKTVSSVWTKHVHAWEKQNIFASREQTPKFPNTQLRSSQKSPYYGDTPGFQNYSATRPTGDIKTDEELEIFLEGFSDPYGEKKKEEKNKYQKTLDGISTALTAASFIPGLDTFTNIAQIPVDLLGAIPIVGEIADIGKTARTADGIVDAAKVVGKADDAVDATRAITSATDNIIDATKVADKTGDAYKTVTVAENGERVAETLYDSSKGSELLSSVSNQKLQSAIKELYRPGAKIGDGGVADAIRHEIKTGNLVGGKSHIQKGRERLRSLERILEKENLTIQEEEMVKELIEDLMQALGGKR